MGVKIYGQNGDVWEWLHFKFGVRSATSKQVRRREASDWRETELLKKQNSKPQVFKVFSSVSIDL